MKLPQYIKNAIVTHNQMSKRTAELRKEVEEYCIRKGLSEDELGNTAVTDILIDNELELDPYETIRLIEEAMEGL